LVGLSNDLSVVTVASSGFLFFLYSFSQGEVQEINRYVQYVASPPTAVALLTFKFQKKSLRPIVSSSDPPRSYAHPC